jgi:hypothetical protein
MNRSAGGPACETLNVQAQCAFAIDKYTKCCDAAVARFGEGEEGARLARIAKGEKV